MLFFVTPRFQRTPAPFANSCRAAVTQKGSTVSFCCGIKAAAIVSKSLRRPGFQKRRPSRRTGVEGIHQHVPSGVEERPRIASHLVIQDAALPPFPYLRDQVRDQDSLSRTRGARDDGVLCLGALGPGDARDTGFGLARCREESSPQAGEKRRNASCERFRRRHLGAPDPVRPRHAPAQEPEDEREQGHAAQADPEAQPGLFMDGIEHAPPDALDPGVGRYQGDLLDNPHAFLPLIHLARIGGIPDGELGLGEGPESHERAIRARSSW